MPRAPKAPKPPPDPLKAPPIPVCDAIIRRFLKTDQNIDWRREMPAFRGGERGLWRAYPSLAFWQGLELPFGGGEHALNHMSWFGTVEGKAHLERAWLLFGYNPSQPEVVPQSTPQPQSPSILDNGGQVADHSGDAIATLSIPPPPVLPARARTVAEMMRG